MRVRACERLCQLCAWRLLSAWPTKQTLLSARTRSPAGAFLVSNVRNFFPAMRLSIGTCVQRGEFRCWLKVAAVLAVAECAGVPDAQAQSSGDFFGSTPHVIGPANITITCSTHAVGTTASKGHQAKRQLADSAARQGEIKARPDRVHGDEKAGRDRELAPSKTYRYRDRGRHFGRSLTPSPKRRAPDSIPRMSPAH